MELAKKQRTNISPGISKMSPLERSLFELIERFVFQVVSSLQDASFVDVSVTNANASPGKVQSRIGRAGRIGTDLPRHGANVKSTGKNRGSKPTKAARYSDSDRVSVALVTEPAYLLSALESREVAPVGGRQSKSERTALDSYQMPAPRPVAATAVVAGNADEDGAARARRLGLMFRRKRASGEGGDEGDSADVSANVHQEHLGPLIDVQVAWEALEDAFTHHIHMPGIGYFLHIPTGDVVRFSEHAASLNQSSRIDTDPNYLRIDTVTSAEQYEWMRQFIASIEDGLLRDALAEAIDGVGAFRRFRDALATRSAERGMWMEFRRVKLRTLLENWLNSQGLRAVPRTAPPQNRAGSDDMADAAANVT